MVFLSLFLCVPIFFFWFLESIHGAIRWLLIKQTVELEKAIGTVEKRSLDFSDVFVISRYLKFSFKDKILGFLKASFTAETVLIFYIALVFVSLLLSKILNSLVVH